MKRHWAFFHLLTALVAGYFNALMVIGMEALFGEASMFATAVTSGVALVGPVSLAVGAIIGLAGNRAGYRRWGLFLLVASAATLFFAGNIAPLGLATALVTFVILVCTANAVQRPVPLVIFGSALLTLLYVTAAAHIISKFLNPPMNSTGYDPKSFIFVGIAVLALISLAIALFSRERPASPELSL